MAEMKKDNATVDGVICDLLDAQNRLVITPHALTTEGQINIPSDLQPGESLATFLNRHVDGIESGAWTVSLGGTQVPQKMWARVYPKQGNLIACRCVVRKQVVMLIAIAVLSYFTLGAGLAMWAPGLAGTMMGSIVGMGLFMAGSLLINKVLGPKPPKPANNPDARATYSLSNQRNSVRAYEPIPVLWGEMKVSPDFASLPYTWYEGEDQYLSTILLGGINVHNYTDLRVGETAITSYENVNLYPNGFSGIADVALPLYSNADSIAGGELVNGGPYITRTTSINTTAIQVDIEGQLMDIDGKGNHKPNTVTLTVETKPVGAPTWAVIGTTSITNSNQDSLRRSYTYSVGLGQYDVRVKLGVPTWNEGGNKDVCKFAWTVLKSIQPDSTNYSQWGRLGIKIKATGQLSGSLDTLNATYIARPIPVWNGTAWVTATSRATGLSNPGAVILQALRGVYSGNILQFGLGLSDEQIDIEGLKAFMLQCTAKGYTYDRWITSTTTLGAFFEEVALAGMGQFSWTDGSRPTVVFVGSSQPISAVINMANMVKGSFSVAYNLGNSADGIEYQYLDRDRNWETQTLRVMAPGVTTMLNPARLTGDGITTEAHAAVMARYHLAQSLYQYKTIDFGADIEHLDYRRLSMLSLSHDMTQWGFGGRVMAAQTLAGKVVLTLDEPVPSLPTRYVGLRVPGSRDYRVFGVEAFTGPSDTITLVGTWPAGVAFPGGTLANPAHDTLWCYDFKATPGYRVRVVSITPEADMKGASVSCVPEGPEFWDYVMNGTYVPAPNQSSLPELGRSSVSNLRVSEQVHVQGDTEWYELHALWDVGGDYDHAQVWAGRDGSELRLVDANAVSTRSSFRIENGGQWLIEVRPFNSGGVGGQMAAVLYITIGTDIVLRNVDNFAVQVVEGGLRRFAWGYTNTRPNTFAGVQIRYLPGNIALNEAMWDAMTPLGELDDTYMAQFETTKPAAGEWTFGIRAIDTSGRLASGIVRYTVVLEPVSIGVIQVDLTPPPAPTNVAIAPAMTTAIATWDAPIYSMGRGHGNSLISTALKVTGQPLPVFADAVLVSSPEDAPASISVEMGGVGYRAWVQHVSKDGGVSLPSSPVDFVTGVDPAKILGILAGQITSSQLNTSLSTPISTIPTLAANIAAEATTRATQTGELYAQYTVKVDVNGYVAGYGLASTLVNGTPTSEFIIRADQFALAPVATDNTANDGSPFFYRTTPTVVNGVTIPAGGYMKSAYIHDASITNAKIANLAVDDAKISKLSVTKLEAGSLKVGSYIQSTDYPTGATSWRISANGTADLAAASIRGQLTAAQIDTRGLSIKDAAGNVILSSGTSLATQISNNLPGDNLVINTDVEYGTSTTPNGWALSASGSPLYVLRLSDANTAPAWNANAQMLYMHTGGASNVQVRWMSSAMPVDSNKTYCVSAWLSSYAGPSTGSYLGVMCYNSAGAELGYVYPSNLSNFGLDTPWIRAFGVLGVGTDRTFPYGTTSVKLVWWATYNGNGANLATRFCFNEGLTPSASIVPFDKTNVGSTNPITAGNASTYIANAAIGAAQIGSIALTGIGNFSVKSAAGGQRMEMDSRVIKIFDASGVLRVQLGDLTI